MGEESNEVRITDPLTGGEKGSKPEDYALIPVEPLAEIARVFHYGSTKYAPFNWQKGYRWNLSISALFRHIYQFLRGHSVDPETGCHHLAHAAFHLFTLMEFERTGKGTDDRGFIND